MPRGRKGKKKKGGNAQGGGSGSPWGQIALGGFRAEFPQPRLPFRLGADTALPRGLSVYPRVKLDVPIIMRNVAIAAGAVAYAGAIDTLSVQDWGTRYAAVFREYAIVGCRLELRPQNISPAAGICAAYMDEQSGAVPTAAEALARSRLDMTLAPLTVPKAYHLDWTPHDLLDLDFTAVGTNFQPVFLKIFANVANFGTSAAETGQILVTGSIAFEFRGYA